jgi:hypothetical protein
MEEVIRNLGVRVEMMVVSFFSATLFTLYRIYETETPPSYRKRISMIIMGLVSALLVPGLVIHFFKIENVFTAGAITGVVVYSFEQVIQIAKNVVIKKINDKDNGTNN